MTAAAHDQARRILESLIEERKHLDPTEDAPLMAANARAILYWRELLSRRRAALSRSRP
jgi:hypothetical protein